MSARKPNRSRFAAMLDVKSPVLRPLWRRVVIVALAGLWTVVEIAGGSMGFAVLFGAATAYLAWQFFVAFDPDDYDPPSRDDP